MASMQSIRYPSPLVSMVGFSNALIWNDTLHVAWRGFAPDFVASALAELFGRGAKLIMASELARSWAVSRGLELSTDEFSLSDDKHPSLNAKGHDVKILCLWLASQLQYDLSKRARI